MLPDEYLAQNIAAQTGVKIITWAGHCEVHERFTAARDPRNCAPSNPGVVVLAHPECPPEVVAEADFAGSTADMSDYVGRQKPARVVLITECSMADNVSVQHPDVEFVPPLQSVPAHEAHHAGQYPRARWKRCARGDDRPGGCGARPPRGRAHAGGMRRGAMTISPLPAIMVEPSVRAALLEDLGRAGDLTTDAIVPAERAHRVRWWRASLAW